MNGQRFEDLKVWKAGHRLALEVYRATSWFPDTERYGLISQLRRASVSIPTNIAEGSKRRTSRDFSYFINIAEGSAAESRYLLLLSQELGFLSDETAWNLLENADHLERMLFRLRQSIENTFVQIPTNDERR